MNGIIPNQYYAMAAMQMIPGHSANDRTGHSDLITTTRMLLSNVTSAAFPYNFPPSSMQMQVVSDSPSDTAAGIGTQEVEIEYLTAPFPINTIEPFKRKEIFVTMNGLTPVLTNATDIYRVDYFRSSRAGSNLQSVGNISLQSVGGATTYERIDAGYNVNRSAIHYVEKGMMSVVADMSFSVNTDAGVRLTISHTDEINGYPIRHATLGLELGSNVISQSFNIPIVTSNPYGKEHYICMLVAGKAANQVAAGTLRFIDLPL